MKHVILEGGFYSPNASEGRWAWNIAHVLDKMAGMGLIKFDLYIPPEAKQQFFYKDTDAWDHFPNAEKVTGENRTYYDVFFLIQPGGDMKWQYLNDHIHATKRVHGQFELYWYGTQIDKRENIPENYEYCYAMKPYSKQPQNNQWPTNGKRFYHLPYAPDFEPDSNNYDSKGILLTIKSPIHNDYSEEDISARVDHFIAAYHFARQGIPVTIGYSNRLFIHPNPKFEERFREIVGLLEKEPNVQMVGNVSPLAMKDLIKRHSVMYTGKVGNVILYASFVDALNYGTVPIIYTDWPEQFFFKDLFTGWQGLRNLISQTDMLLQNDMHYNLQLETLRYNIDLYTEADMIKRLKGIIGCHE